MRLFVAVELPDDIKDALAALRLDSVAGARRTKRDQLHLTLRFIGDGIAPPQFAAIKAALAAVRAAPFALQFRGVGQFPPGKKPARVLWAGLAPNPALPALQQQIEHALRSAGLAPEDRPFSAHITLARLDPPAAAARFLAQHAAFSTPAFPVEQFVLFSSVLARGGATHHAQAVYPLK
ncbi:MAG: RNA 2',3'-cyclic phosphodiesterase [Chloroflexi bacterium]|nr:RNA 2',3'-cyclic phosphodiesterase [Chloroflexota bacterium]